MGVSFLALVIFCEFPVLRFSFAPLRLCVRFFVFLMLLGALLVIAGFGHVPRRVLELTQ